MAPVSQKADRRPIAFYLDDGVSGLTTYVPLVVRPEDLTRTEPSLQTVTQSLDGAWVDDFGRGVASIQISGHTGWNLGEGWEAHFDALRKTVFQQWHDSRADAVAKGRNPDDVKLIFADALDSIVNVVAPGPFVTKRNKSRPLLMMYQISMTVLSEQLSADMLDKLKLNPDGTSNDDALVAGAESLRSSMNKIQKLAANVRNFIDVTIATPVHNFMVLSTTALNKVLSTVDSARSIVTPQAQQFIGVAADLALVGRNIFYAYNTVVGLPDAIRFQISQAASAYENAYCVLKNAFRKVKTYPDYSGIYGASICSSTSGGAPLSVYANANTFESILPGISLPPTVTTGAREGIGRVKAMDFVLSPMSVPDLGAAAAVISSGVSYG